VSQLAVGLYTLLRSHTGGSHRAFTNASLTFVLLCVSWTSLVERDVKLYSLTHSLSLQVP